MPETDDSDTSERLVPVADRAAPPLPPEWKSLRHDLANLKIESAFIDYLRKLEALESQIQLPDKWDRKLAAQTLNLWREPLIQFGDAVIAAYDTVFGAHNIQHRGPLWQAVYYHVVRPKLELECDSHCNTFINMLARVQATADQRKAAIKLVRDEFLEIKTEFYRRLTATAIEAHLRSAGTTRNVGFTPVSTTRPVARTTRWPRSPAVLRRNIIQRNQNATNNQLVALFDINNPPVPVPEKWAEQHGIRNWADAYRDPEFKAKVETIIAKDRSALALTRRTRRMRPPAR